MIVAARRALAFATSHELPWSGRLSDLADAAKIKSMKAPDGSYVFPRAEEVGRAFAAELLSMDSVRFASPN